jgi:hypothetical protein
LDFLAGLEVCQGYSGRRARADLPCILLCLEWRTAPTRNLNRDRSAWNRAGLFSQRENDLPRFVVEVLEPLLFADAVDNQDADTPCIAILFRFSEHVDLSKNRRREQLLENFEWRFETAGENYLSTATYNGMLSG